MYLQTAQVGLYVRRVAGRLLLATAAVGLSTGIYEVSNSGCDADRQR